MKLKNILLSAFLLAGLGACSQDENTAETSATPTAEQIVNVYSHRHYETDQKLFKQFTDTTGIKVNVIEASADELIKRLEMEKEASPSDLLITVDAGRLERAEDKGLLQPVTSETLTAQVPEHLRDSENNWYALTKRARVIVYDKARVKPEALSTYENLADPAWKGKILIRSSENIYNQSLLASIIAANGPEAAQKWAEGVKNNMAVEPKGGDRDQIIGVASGQGEIAVVNTYYLGLLQNSPEQAQKEAANKVGVFFPNQQDRGTHVNVSGIGVTKYSKNKENAVKLMEFLTSPAAQEQFAAANYEYPVNPNVSVSPTLKAWGDFKEDKLNLSLLGEHNAEAVTIFDKVGWK